MSNNDKEIKDRAKLVLAKTMKLNPEELGDQVGQEDLSNWDSVHHMNVVLGLENEFDIEFLDSELSTLTSLPAIVSVVKSHLEN
jgi:acyl carrier protein